MTDAPLRRPIRIHGLADARAAAAVAESLNRPVTLVGAGYGGASWLIGIATRVAREHPEVAVAAVLDCGDRAGEAQAALAAGLKHVLFTGPAGVAARLAGIAADRRATLLTALLPLFDPRGLPSPEETLRTWLSSNPD